MSDFIREALDPVRWAIDDAETLLRHALRELRMAEIDVEGEVDFSDIEPNHEPTPWERRRDLQLAALQASFEQDIVEPPGRNNELIDPRIRTTLGINWTWAKKYVKNGQFAWCGTEAAVGENAAGLLPAIAQKVMPSCYRLYKFCQLEDPSKARVVPRIEDALPTDIVIVGPADGKKWGAHITTLLEVDLDKRRVFLHEGNAKAFGPDGKTYREGVGRRWRNLDRKRPSEYVPMHIYRLLDEDYAPVAA